MNEGKKSGKAKGGGASRMMTFHVPADKDLLAALGEVAVRHEHLNYILRMTIKTIAGLEIAEALDATAHEGSSQLRDRIRKLARLRLGEGQALLKLQALLERCKRATEKRNGFVHSVWAREFDGEPARKGNGDEWEPLPTPAELHDLGEELMRLTALLNEARLGGFIEEALSKRLPKD